MDQTWVATFCVTLAFLSGVSSVRLLIGTSMRTALTYDTETKVNSYFTKDHGMSSLDYHFSKRYIYFAGDDVIRSSSDPNNKEVILIEKGLGRVDGIAVDWINNILYWARYEKIELVKANLDGNNKKIIVTRRDLDKVEYLHYANRLYCIEVDPYERLLFMLVGVKDDWYHGKVVQSNLEGRDLAVAIYKEHKYTGITTFSIDRLQKILYLVMEGLFTIRSHKYSGELIDTFSVCSKIRQIHSLVVYRRKMYMAYAVENDMQTSYHEQPLASVKCKREPEFKFREINSIRVYSPEIQMSTNAYNSFKRIKQRFSNWEECLSYSTEWERTDCLEMSWMTNDDHKRATSAILLLGGGVQPIYLYDTYTQEIKTIESDKGGVSNLDYHYSKGYIYYTGWNVVRRSIDPNNKDFKIIEKDIHQNGLAVDWINNNIYWTRSEKLEVVKANLDGNNKISIVTKRALDQVKRLSNSLNLYDLKVDPYDRSLFMIVSPDKRGMIGILVKFDLQGRNLTAITHRKYERIIAYAIERFQKMLYVVKPTNGGIYSCNYDGLVIEEFSVCSNIGSMYSFAIFRQNMYFSTVGGHEGVGHFYAKPLTSMKCSTEPSKADNIRDFNLISDIRIYSRDIQQPLNVYNSYQRIKQRFSNWNKCLSLSTEWDRIDCLEMVPVKTVNNKSASGVELLIGRSNGIIQWHDTETQESKVIVNDSFVLSLDYHYSKGYVYYAGDSIKRRSFDHRINDLKEISDDRYVYGIAVDWINDHLYWTRSIDVEVVKADLDGNEQTSILTQSFLNQLKGLSNINYLYNIEVDPYERALFMIAGTEREILIGTVIKSDLEGRNMSVVTHNKYKFIAAFTVDRQPKILYAAMKGYQGIHSCTYNGEIIEEFSVCPKMYWIYPFAMFRKHMYMAYGYEEHGNNNIFYSGQLASVKCPLDILNSDNIILGIKVYSIDVQQPLNVSNSHQLIKQRFSNWDTCSLLSTEWERIDCLERA